VEAISDPLDVPLSVVDPEAPVVDARTLPKARHGRSGSPERRLCRGLTEDSNLFGLGGSAKVYIERSQGQITAEGKFQVSSIVGRELMANGELKSRAPSLLIRIGVNLDRKAAQVGDA